MPEEDLSDVIGGLEKMGFELAFESGECGRVSDVKGQRGPEGWGGDGEGSSHLHRGSLGDELQAGQFKVT